jgi:hypothetical protein
MDTETQLPKDLYSRTLARLLNHPQAIRTTSTIDALTDLGHSETWVITTVRVEGYETLFVQHINAEGGQRFVLPAVVANALARQREQVLAVSRRRAAHKGVATRKAKAAKKS